MFLIASFVFPSGMDGECHASCFPHFLSSHLFRSAVVNESDLSGTILLWKISAAYHWNGWGSIQATLTRTVLPSYSDAWLYHVPALPSWSFFPFLYPQQQRHQAKCQRERFQLSTKKRLLEIRQITTLGLRKLRLRVEFT